MRYGVIIFITLMLCSLENVYATTFSEDNIFIQKILNGQDTLSYEEKIAKNLNDYLVSVKEEKLFLHIDKESCQAGDTLWFRGYLFGAATNNISDLSRYIYVELLDRNNVVQWREKVGLSSTDSIFKGYYPISEDIKQGDYILHAYTYWMQNQEDSFHFSKLIRILNPYDHKINTKLSIVRDGNRKVLRIEFLNKDGERYVNFPFVYKIPGETPDDRYEWVNTGYNGISRIVIKDSLSDHIWLRSTNGSNWDLEQYHRIPGTKLDFDLQFFPEGGNLICNKMQRIAFKATRRDGLGMPINGVIKDSKGKVIAKINSNHLGIGSVELSMNPNVAYKAIVSNSEGNVKEFPIKISGNMYAKTLKLYSNGENVIYDILSNDSVVDVSSHFLLIHSKGIPMGIFNAEAMRGKNLNLSGTPEGILHFVLLDNSFNVLSQRLWFHRKYQRDSLKVLLPNEKVSPRDEATIDISFIGCGTDSLSGSFSIGVVNNGQTMNMQNGETIESYLLLSSDILGYVEQPGYYFSGTDSCHVRALDDLMLTQGWSRFDVSECLKSKIDILNPFYLERGQFLSGYVKNFRGKNSINSEIILIGTNGIVRELVTDSLGSFVENDIWYDIGTRFIVQAISEKGRQNQELQLDEPIFRPYYSKLALGESESSADYVKMFSKDYIYSDNGEQITTLGVVRVYGNGIAKIQEEIIQEIERDARRNFMLGLTGVSTFGGPPGDWGSRISYGRYYGDAFRFAYTKRINNLEKRMNFRRNGSVSSNFSRYITSKETNAYGVMNGEKASMIINDNSSYGNGLLGVYMAIPGFSSRQPSRNPNDVESMGVVGIPVYDISVHSVEYQFNMQTIVPFAPQQQNVEFYKPNYDVVTELLKHPIDEVITRYWNPNVKISSDTPFTFSFPTAGGDGNHSYTITINGVTNNGTPVHKSVVYDLR